MQKQRGMGEKEPVQFPPAIFQLLLAWPPQLGQVQGVAPQQVVTGFSRGRGCKDDVWNRPRKVFSVRLSWLSWPCDIRDCSCEK